jgi:hypothetical protein
LGLAPIVTGEVGEEGRTGASCASSWSLALPHGAGR